MTAIKINTDEPVAEYIRGKYFNPDLQAVHFPANLDIYVFIYDLLKKRPIDCPIDTGNLTLVLPDRREANYAGGKSPEQYNYLCARSAELLNQKMRTMMWAELHDYLDEQKHINGVPYKDSVYMFMTKYGIESISEDALWKNYQRWREKLRKRSKRGYNRKSANI
jgi:hypothetical protein